MKKILNYKNNPIYTFLCDSSNVDSSSYIWNMIGSVLNSFQSVFILMILTRVLGNKEAGLFAIAYANANLFLNVGKYGMRNFQVSDYKRIYSFETYKRSRYLTTLAMIIVSTVYLLITSRLREYSNYKSLLVIWMCIWKTIDSLEDVYHGELQRNGRLDIAGKMLTIRLLTGLSTWIIIVFVLHNQVIATFISCVVSFLVFIFLAHLVKEYIDEELILTNLNFTVIDLLKKCWPLFISTFLSFYLGNAPKYAIDSQLTDELQACYGFISMPVFVIGLLNNFLFNPIVAKLSKMWVEKDYDSFFRTSIVQMFVVFCITIFCIIGAYYLGIPVLSFLYNTDLYNYKIDLVIILIGGGFLALVGLLQTLITIIRLQNKLVYGYFVNAIIAILCYTSIVKKHGIRGAVTTYTVLMFFLFMFFLLIFYLGFITQRKKERNSL